MARLVRQRCPRVVEGERVIAVVQVDSGQRQVDVPVLADRHGQFGAAGQLIAPVVVVRAEIGVVIVAITLELLYRKPELTLVSQGSRHHQLRSPGIKVARTEPQRGPEGVLGFVCFQMDESGQRIGAVAGSLGAPQDLYLINVQQRRGGAHATVVYIVNEHPNRRVEGLYELAALANAPDLEEPGPIGTGGKVDVGQCPQHFFEMLGSA